MTISKKVENIIYQQLEANGRKNLFYRDLDKDTFFLPETKEFIRKHKDYFLCAEKENQSWGWIEKMTNQALKTFCGANQYLDFRNEHVVELLKIYNLLWQEMITELKKDEIYFDVLQRSHLKRISDWLRKTNPFVKEINKAELPEVVEVVCAQYSAQLQMGLFQLEVADLIEPVLDLGCGEDANLVKYLRNLGVNAYGMDRLCHSPSEYLMVANWMEFDFKVNSWGTIISNHSFALHFSHHNERPDGAYVSYAKKYMEILSSLKINGTFHYAPALPFIEEFLPSEKYGLLDRRIEGNFSISSITRMK